MPIEDHPLRYALANELHARPFPSLASPSTAVFLAVKQPTEAVANTHNIRILPMAPIFAQAILNIWNGTSVSSLFETDTIGPIYEGIL